MPIWKKEVYEGAEAEWKENKESAVPTVGKMQALQSSAAKRRHAALCLAAAATFIAVGCAVKAVRGITMRQ